MFSYISYLFTHNYEISHTVYLGERNLGTVSILGFEEQ